MGKKSGQPAGQSTRPIETELRLVGDPETLQRAFEAPVLASNRNGEVKRSVLKSSYYDTVGHELRAQGLALRVRASGKDGLTQTLKAGDHAQAALLKRAEWNMSVNGEIPSLDALPKEARLLLPKDVRQSPLRKSFETHVQRQVKEVTVNGHDQPASRIEAALDLGEIKTEAGPLPIAELELELLEGEPQSLYQMALELQQIGRFSLETRSKSSRAYDHLGGQPPKWHRAVSPRLKPSHTVDEAMAAIFESCFGQWLANQAAAVDGRDPEGVHQMRIGLRRLRSAFSVFRPLIPEDQLIWLREGAKQTINALGPARDWDVFQSDLLAPVIAARPNDPALRAIRTKARTKGRMSYRAMRRRLDSEGYTRFVLRFGIWVEGRGWHAGADPGMTERRAASIKDFGLRTVKKRQKKALTAGRNFAELSVEQRHDLRIAFKKLRYAAEFFSPVLDKKTLKPLLKAAKKLQEDLGHMNDVAVAEDLLQGLLQRSRKQDLSRAAGIIIGWHMGSGTTSEKQLLELWNDFAKQPAF